MIKLMSIRRALGAALFTTAFLAGLPATSASASNEIPRRVCNQDWRAGRWQLRQLIKCAARRWDAPGTPRKAVAVARCESHLRPRAYNPNGYAGVFQQATRYWARRADVFGQPDRSVFNGRANILVSVRMASAANSWSAWAGCA